MNRKPIYVTFRDKKLENKFETLNCGKSENKHFRKFSDFSLDKFINVSYVLK